MKHIKLLRRIETIWKEIGQFESHEQRKEKDFEVCRWEARTSARMKAYDEIIERLFDNEILS